MIYFTQDQLIIIFTLQISDLVRETLYPDLIDGDIVKGYQPVRGISKNLFCVVLEDLPQNIDSLLEKFHVQNQKNLSKENFHEFVFIFSLANYLRQQGYKAHEVVIFTTGSDNEVESLESFMVLSPLLKDVRVKSVEKFQGQECRIGIISLATTDQNPNMVSIASDDRLYVLLTRAQEGNPILFFKDHLTNLEISLRLVYCGSIGSVRGDE